MKGPMKLSHRQVLAVRDMIRVGLLNAPATTALVTALHAAYERAAVVGPRDKVIGRMVQEALEAYASERANNLCAQVDEVLDGVRREEEAGR